MFAWLTRILLALRSVIEARASREAEILVLRQQLLVLSRKSPAVLRKIIRVATSVSQKLSSVRVRVRRATRGGRGESYSFGRRCEVASSSTQSSSV